MALVLAPIAWFVAIPIGHGLVPWLLTWLTPRFGWTDGRPATWNMLGLIPIAFGAALLLWILFLGLSRYEELPERVDIGWKPQLLLVRGPYTFTRNPMYLAELGLWAGWAVFFGSAAVAAGAVALFLVVRLVVVREERDLEAKFPDRYREYKATVPRWIRLPR